MVEGVDMHEAWKRFSYALKNDAGLEAGGKAVVNGNYV
eukprot:COSAG06_NODE_2936_length_6063_cov_6.578806_1_plen_38_part_00